MQSCSAQDHNPEKLAQLRREPLLPRIVLCVALLRSVAAAQVSSYGDKADGPDERAAASILKGVGIAQHLNQQLPLNLDFYRRCRQAGASGSYFGKRPAILALVYLPCPMLCSEELNGLTSALQMVRYVPGKDFNMIVVSIDPDEGHGPGRGQEAQLSEALRAS